MGWVGSALLWVLAGFITVRMAKNRNRDGTGWFIISLLLSPLVAWITLAVIGPNKNKRITG